MNFLEIRNRIIQCLSEYLQCPIMLNNQQNPEAEYPYLFYSAAPYTPEGGQGDYQLEKLDDGYLEKRTGEPFPLHAAAPIGMSVTSMFWERMKLFVLQTRRPGGSSMPVTIRSQAWE